MCIFSVGFTCRYRVAKNSMSTTYIHTKYELHYKLYFSISKTTQQANFSFHEIHFFSIFTCCLYHRKRYYDRPYLTINGLRTVFLVLNFERVANDFISWFLKMFTWNFSSLYISKFIVYLINTANFYDKTDRINSNSYSAFFYEVHTNEDLVGSHSVKNSKDSIVPTAPQNKKNFLWKTLNTQNILCQTVLLLLLLFQLDGPFTLQYKSKWTGL